MDGSTSISNYNGFGGFLGGYDAVAPGVEFRIFLLIFRMGENVVEGDADALIERNVCAHFRNDPLQLAVVENNGNGFVADEAAFQVIAVGCADGGEVFGRYVRSV